MPNLPSRGVQIICTKLLQRGGFGTYSTFYHICMPVGAFDLALRGGTKCKVLLRNWSLVKENQWDMVVAWGMCTKGSDGPAINYCALTSGSHVLAAKSHTMPIAHYKETHKKDVWCIQV